MPLPTRVYACSGYVDPIADSAVVVGGWFDGWELIDNATRPGPKTGISPQNDPNYYGPYAAIRLGMTVERVYKGTVDPTIEMFAGNTLLVGATYQWVGTSGACGAFDADPTGQYAILGLYLDDFGRYRPELRRLFYIGDEPPTDFAAFRLERLTPLLPGYAPASAQTESDFPWVPVIGLAVLGPLALLAGAALLWRRGESHNG